MPVTGRGEFPLRSAWLSRGRGRGSRPRKVVNVAATNSANEAVWKDWAFDSVTPNNATVVVTFANVALSSNGALRISGQTSQSLQDATIETTGSLRIAGSLSVTFENVSLASVGFSGTIGTLTATLSPVALVANAELILWTPVNPSAASWSAQTPSTGSWTPQSPNATTWNTETPASGTWTPQPPASGIWS